MNTTIIKVAAGLVILASLLWALACGVGSNQNGTAADQDQRDADSACGETNINTRRDKVANKIANRIEAKTRLQEQVNAGVFNYNIDVIDANTAYASLQMTIRGGVGDVHDNTNTKDYENFHELVGIVQKFVRKKCTSRVVFASSGNANAPSPPSPQSPEASNTGAVIVGDFRWFACEWPNVPCNGACLPSCDRKNDPSSDASNPPANSNSNSAPNSNKPKKDT
jgi:hypothetical protein